MGENKKRNSFGTFQKDEAADAETQNVQRKNPFEEVGEKHRTRYFAKGYLSEMKEALTAKEIELLPLSVNLMTYESGIRFLTDYLNGDTYFKIDYEKHNLDRTRNQLALVLDIEKKLDNMNDYIMSTYQKYKKSNCGKTLVKNN